MVLCVAGRYSLPLPALPGILVPARTSSETTRREIHLMTNFVYVNIVYFDVGCFSQIMKCAPSLATRLCG